MNKMPRHVRLLFSFGLLTLSLSTMMRTTFHYSDRIWGIMIGAGIGMEVLALILMWRHKNKQSA